MLHLWGLNDETIKHTRMKKEVIETKVFEDKGTWSAYNAAVSWANQKGYTGGSMSHPHPTALVKGDYSESPLPWKWKNFNNIHFQYVDGTISGEFREGPVTVHIFK